jgi:hypothetical protein
MKRSRFSVRVGRTGAVLAFVAIVGASPASAAPPLVVLAEGLSSPKGLGLADSWDPVVVQGAFGAPGPVLQYLRTGPSRGSTIEVSPTNALVDVAISPDGAGWGLGSDRVLYLQDESGVITPVLDIAAYQAADPDPYDQDGDADQSNPYGLAALGNGDVLVADAQNNDLLRVSRTGAAVTVARFLPEGVATDLLPDPLPFPLPGPLPPIINAEAVPTGIAIGLDGWAYVSELKGFPFRPGSSNVYRVNPWAEDATCSTAANADCSVAMTGFTALIDIAVNPNNGTVYTYSLAADGVLAFEEGFGTGVFPPAVLTEVKGGKQRELVAGQLSQPGGVAVARDGTVFATDGVFFGGRLLQIRG